MRTWTLFLRTLLANVVIAPVVGTALAGPLQYGIVFLVLGGEIAGVPFVVYAFLSTCIPVAVLTTLANLICWRITRKRPGVVGRGWYVAGASFAALAGALAGLLLLQTAAIVTSGAAAGVACGLVQAAIWRR